MRWFVGLAAAVIAAVLIYKDASSLEERGAQVTPALWAVLAFLALILALPAYLILRLTVWRRQIQTRKLTSDEVARQVR